MTELMDRFTQAAAGCEQAVTWHRPSTPAQGLRALADLAEELGLDTWDTYGDGGAVEQLESEIATTLGKPAAVLFPTGVMAQQAALRIWCDRSGVRRVALPDLSHLITNEEDGPRLLHGFEFDYLTTGRQLATADKLAAIPGRLGAVLVELPLRDAGCLLPSWAELTELSAALRTREVPLHLDGARIWEAQASYDRPHAEIAGLADSVYVSLYKGLAGPGGAVVATDTETARELRVWRKRTGGTLYRLTPLALGGLLGLRRELPRMGEYLTWARSFAAALRGHGVRANPEVPHINTFQLYAPGDPDVINERLIDVMTEHRVQLSRAWRPADSPGTATAEFAVYAAATDFDPTDAADRLAGVLCE